MSLLSIFLISQLVNASVLKEKYARMKRGRRNNWFTKRALSYDWLVGVLNNVFQFIQRILSPLSTSSRVFFLFLLFLSQFLIEDLFRLQPTYANVVAYGWIMHAMRAYFSNLLSWK